MVLVRVLLICVIALGPLGMAAAGVSGGEQNVMSVDCHGASDDTSDMSARHCSGMGCCVMIEQAMLSITLVGQQFTFDYGVTIDPMSRQAWRTRPDKPPRIF